MDQACDLVDLPWIYRKAVAYLNTLLVSTCSGDLVQKAYALRPFEACLRAPWPEPHISSSIIDEITSPTTGLLDRWKT